MAVLTMLFEMWSAIFPAANLEIARSRLAIRVAAQYQFVGYDYMEQRARAEETIL